jgi:hypothetical protein
VPWAQFDDHFPQSEKALKAGVEALGLHLCATCWSTAHLKDGNAPESVVEWLLTGCEGGEELIRRLEDSGLWERQEGGWRLTDFYENHNRSREEVEADRKAKQERGRRGGQANAKRHRKASEQPAKDDGEDPLERL